MKTQTIGQGQQQNGVTSNEVDSDCMIIMHIRSKLGQPSHEHHVTNDTQSSYSCPHIKSNLVVFRYDKGDNQNQTHEMTFHWCNSTKDHEQGSRYLCVPSSTAMCRPPQEALGFVAAPQITNRGTITKLQLVKKNPTWQNWIAQRSILCKREVATKGRNKVENYQGGDLRVQTQHTRTQLS